MRNALFFLTVSLTTASCASLHERVYDSIHEGDSTQHVVDVLGKPDTFSPSVRESGAQAWYYNSRKETCGFTIKDNKVKSIGCVLNPVVVTPNPQSRSISCTTNKIGNMSRTDCN